MFVKVSYRAELKPKAETAVELLHHSKDKTCRQVRTCFFSRAFFSQVLFFQGIFFLKHCFSRTFFSQTLFFSGIFFSTIVFSWVFFLRKVQNYFFSCPLPPNNSKSYEKTFRTFRVKTLSFSRELN